MDLAELVARVPEGTTEVRYAGRRWSLSRTTRAGGRAVSVYAEELGGAAYVSANVYRTGVGEPLLKPCEMPAADVLAFLAGVDLSPRWPPRPRR